MEYFARSTNLSHRNNRLTTEIARDLKAASRLEESISLREVRTIAMCTISSNRTHKLVMRTNIEIDDELIREALRISGLKTKRAVVEAGLRMLLRLKRQEDILNLVGKVHWEGNLDESRQGRDFT